MVDVWQLGSHLPEISSRLRASGLSSPSSRSPRSSRVMVLSWEGSEAPNEGLLPASSARRHLGAHPSASWANEGCQLAGRARDHTHPKPCSKCPASSPWLILLSHSPAQGGSALVAPQQEAQVPRSPGPCLRTHSTVQEKQTPRTGPPLDCSPGSGPSWPMAHLIRLHQQPPPEALTTAEALGLAPHGCPKLDTRALGAWGWGGVGGSRMEAGKSGAGRPWRSMWGVKRWAHALTSYLLPRQYQGGRGAARQGVLLEPSFPHQNPVSSHPNCQRNLSPQLSPSCKASPTARFWKDLRGHPSVGWWRSSCGPVVRVRRHAQKQSMALWS